MDLRVLKRNPKKTDLPAQEMDLPKLTFHHTTTPRAVAARHTPPSHTDTPTTPTHTRTTQPPHAHARCRAGGWVGLAVGDRALASTQGQQTAPTTPRTAAARHTLPSHTNTPTTPTHTRTPQPPHAHARRSAGRWAWKWVVYGRSGRAGRRSLKKSAPSLAFSTAVPTRERRSAGKTGAGETHNGEWAGRVRWAARRVARRRVRRGVYGRGVYGRGVVGFGAQRGASVDGRLMRLPRA